MTNTQRNAIAKVGPEAMIERYRNDFAQVLPKHIEIDQWVRVSLSAMRRDPKLLAAATRDPQSLMTALWAAAQLGLTPGTEEFYLRPLGGGVQGIVGYQGYIELIYRAGATSSVIAELVHENDHFEFSPSEGAPKHTTPDWFDDRGKVKGAYAYGILKDGTTSKVVIIGKREIERARSASPASERGGPWQTDYPAMVLKTAIRQLRKWLPTSAEYRREQLRAVAEVAGHAPATVTATQVATIIPDDEPMPPPPWVDEDGVIEAESYDVEDPA